MNKTINYLEIGAYTKTKSRKRNWIKQLLSIGGGGIVGLITGLLGGGGGSLVVPLYQATGLEERTSHGTAIATILPLSVIGGTIYAMRGNYPLVSGLWVTGGVVIGGVIGSLLLKKINPILLSVIFYGIMIYVGAKMLF